MAAQRAVPVWFGPEESPLFGTLHGVDGPTRGVLVLCQPIGREYSSAHSTFTQLAVRLAHLGFTALRFDYRSTGDSFDRTGDRPDGSGFVQDVSHAVEFARTLGVARIGIVGMRLGAAFAVYYCRSEPVDALVLWDPCPNGRSFLREQRALGLVAGLRNYEDSGGAFELPGFKLSAGMRDEISGLDLTSGQASTGEERPMAGNVLLLTRSECVADRGLAAGLALPRVEHRLVTGQPRLLDVHPLQRTVPAESLASIGLWLDDVMPRGGSVITAPTRCEVTAPVCSGGAGSSEDSGGTALVRERAVSLGPVGLFGIDTQPEAGGHGPTCIFVSVANEHRIGPGRLWVQLSRSLAAGGFRCVRIDVNGFGDSPSRAGLLTQPVLSVLGIDDVLDAAGAVSPEDPGDVVLFGLSASGYQILEAALSLSPRGVCSVNPSVVFRPPEMTAGDPMDDRRRFCLPRTAFATAFATAARDETPVQWLDQRFRTLSSRLPKPLRRAAWRVRRGAAPLRNKPGERLGDLVTAGTDVLLICGPEEIQPFLETGMGEVDPAEQGGRLQVEEIPTLEHALFSSKDRDLVAALILDHVFTHFRRAPAT